jgi:8-oxo-dGTP pyrophosphatase MutT (NUDIX family)
LSTWQTAGGPAPFASGEPFFTRVVVSFVHPDRRRRGAVSRCLCSAFSAASGGWLLRPVRQPNADRVSWCAPVDPCVAVDDLGATGAAAARHGRPAGLTWRPLVTISDEDIGGTLSAYLACHPDEAGLLAEPLLLLAQGRDFASRRTFPMHITVGALLVRGDVRASAEILLVEHRAYGITLQPGGHLEPTDTSLVGAAVRELAEETGVDPCAVFPTARTPVYIEFGRVPARPAKNEPEHYHLDIGYAVTTVHADVGRIQESEVHGAAWYPLAEATRLVGPRIGRVVSEPARLR